MNLVDLMYDTKVCSTCGKEKPMTEEFFGRHNSTSDGFRNECKECRMNRLHHHWNEDRTRLKCFLCGEYKNPDEFNSDKKKPHRGYKDRRCKKCRGEETKKRRKQRYKGDPLRRILVERLSGAKDRCKKKNTFIDLTLEDLQFLWKKQEGRCAISNIDMTYEMGKGRVHTNVSIDQIEPSRGYTLSNVQLVCMAVNQMKADLSIDKLLEFCEAISANARKWNKK